MLKIWIYNFFFYLISVSIVYCVFYFLVNKRLKIQKGSPSFRHKFRELKYSLISLFFFIGFTFLLTNEYVLPHTLIYTNGDLYGVPYFVFSIILCIIIHDAYFYWTHRLLHIKKFQRFHRLHHHSTNPTPWAAFAFHPIEAFVQYGIIIILPFTIPLHPLALLIFQIISTLYSIYIHSGYEVCPKFLLKSKSAEWVNSSLGHNMHHQFHEKNYGLYFRFWDVIMHTDHHKYKEKIDLIVNHKVTNNK